MTEHIKPPTNLNSKENSLQVEKNVTEETVDSNKILSNYAKVYGQTSVYYTGLKLCIIILYKYK